MGTIWVHLYLQLCGEEVKNNGNIGNICQNEDPPEMKNWNSMASPLTHSRYLSGNTKESSVFS